MMLSACNYVPSNLLTIKQPARVIFNNDYPTGGSNMGQQVKVLFTKSNDLSLSPGKHVLEEKKTTPN